MPDTTLLGTYVSICDWQGRLVWVSGENTLIQPGDFIWQHLAKEGQEPAKAALARVAALREKVVLESVNSRGKRFRAWMWPLHSPEMAVCVLAVAIPSELSLLTEREGETLTLLAQGLPTREIAKKMDVSTSTIHSNLRRARKKLNEPSLEALTAFAARYCHPHAMPTHDATDFRSMELNSKKS